MDEEKTEDPKKKLLLLARERFQVMKEADRDNLREAMANMKFVNVPGAQWEQEQKDERRDRPCWEFNRVRVNAKRIINHIRTNRPSPKVRGVENSDKQAAEYREGLIRNIWDVSDFPTTMDYAAEFQVGGGMGAWRVDTDYIDDMSFDLDICIKPILNPFCLFHDPGAQDMLKRDANDWILTERISQKEYKRRYPKAEIVDFEDHEFDDEDDDWGDDEQTRIAEYWYKEPTTKEILRLKTGEVLEADSEDGLAVQAQFPDEIDRRRTVKTHKIKMAVLSGNAVLDEQEWPGTQFPFVKVYGEHMVVDGKTRWYGIATFSKDAQRSYNISRTAISETIAGAPLEFEWATTKQADGNIDQWNEAHKENLPVRIYNPDPEAPGPPMKSGGASVPVALIQESQIAASEIDAVTGIYQEDRGERGQSQSGRAIYARQDQGQMVTFNYPDNMSKGVQRTCEIVLDLIPKIYDAARSLRILGKDGEEDYLEANKFVQGPEGEQIKLNDLTVGKYDVTVTTGPSYTTKRQEFVEIISGLFGNNSDMLQIYGDLMYKAMDLPYSDEMAERARVLLPPEIQGMLNEDQEVPPEVQGMMQQAEQAMQMVEQQSQAVQQAAQQAEMEKTEIEKMMAELDKAQAQFEAKIAKEMARLAKVEAGLVKKSLEDSAEGVVEAAKEEAAAVNMEFNSIIGGELAQAMQGMQEIALSFNKQAVDAVEAIRQEKDDKPKLVRVDAVRVGGKLSAVPVYEDGE